MAWKKQNPQILQLASQPRSIQLLEKLIENQVEIISEQQQEIELEDELKELAPQLEIAQNNQLEAASIRAAAERAASIASEAELNVEQSASTSDRELARQIISQSSAEVKALLKRTEQNAIRGKNKTKLEKELSSIEEHYKKTTKKLRKALKDTEIAQHKLDESQHEWLRIETLKALAKHVGLLKAEQPCPLCGSTNHPSPISEADKVDLKELEVQRSKLQDVLSSATKKANEAEAIRKTIAAQKDSTKRQLEELKKTDEIETQNYVITKSNLSEVWIKSGLAHALGLNKVGILLPNTPPETKDLFDAALKQLQIVEVAIAHKEKEAAALKNAKIEAEAKVAQLRVRTSEANALLQQLKTLTEQKLELLQKIRSRLSQRQGTIDQLKAELLRQLDYWPNIIIQIDNTPKQLLNTMTQSLDVWLQRDKQEKEQDQQIHQYLFENNQLTEELKRQQTEETTISLKLKNLKEAKQQTTKQRQLLLGGLSTQEAEAALQVQRKKISETQEQHKVLLETSKQKHTHATATLNERKSSLSFAEKSLESAKEQYEQSLLLVPDQLRNLVEQSLKTPVSP